MGETKTFPATQKFHKSEKTTIKTQLNYIKKYTLLNRPNVILVKAPLMDAKSKIFKKHKFVCTSEKILNTIVNQKTIIEK